jgi:hypothetical protein
MQKGSGIKTAFGLDIAGYSTGKSGFARADLVDKNHIEVTVYEKHIFASKITGEDQIEDIVKKENMKEESKKEGNLFQIANCLELTSKKEKEINRLISNGKEYPAPKGYVLLKSLPNMKRCIKCKELTHEELLKEMAR